jgi:hypothetical protein
MKRKYPNSSQLSDKREPIADRSDNYQPFGSLSQPFSSLEHFSAIWNAQLETLQVLHYELW